MAAMGGDNVAMNFSHQWLVNSRLRFQDGPGVSLEGNQRISILIGDLTGISKMPVGGIMGMDLVMRCGVLRCSWQQEPFQIAMYK